VPTRAGDVRQLFEEMVATQPDIRVKGKVSRYTSMNGNMFAFVTQEGAIALRLGDAEREAFMKRYETGPVVQYGAVMRGYVEVPAALLKRKQDLARHFAASVAHARTLAARPTTRKQATHKKAAKK
jgi:TfoX N-terminal domain